MKLGVEVLKSEYAWNGIFMWGYYYAEHFTFYALALESLFVYFFNFFSPTLDETIKSDLNTYLCTPNWSDEGIPMWGQLEYKYALSIDGHTTPWNRLTVHLLAG
jgi:hypothetical protein